MTAKRIGLIGNMNNNNFALLRYMVDHGLDAKLILMKNDGLGKNAHFSIASDTQDENKWSKYIKKTNIYEHHISALNFPFSWILFAFILVKSFFDKRNLAYPVSKRNIVKDLCEFDYFIGSGITPATLKRVGFNLTIFYPYAFGVEYLDSPVFKTHLQSKNSITRFFAKKIYVSQLMGIKQSEFVINGDIGYTKDILDSHGINQMHLGLPMVYPEECENLKNYSENFQSFLSVVQMKEFVLLSHARHLWKKPENISDSNWILQNKHNEWIIKGYSDFLLKHEANSILVLFETGDDVEETKDLCSELGIDQMVLWLPKSSRFEILKMIDHIDVGLGEFYSGFETLWGGTMIELLSRGKPVIHGLNFSKEKFETAFLSELPPILISNSVSEITANIEYLYLNRKEIKKIGKHSKLWFDKNYGCGLVAKWAKLLD